MIRNQVRTSLRLWRYLRNPTRSLLTDQTLGLTDFDRRRRAVKLPSNSADFAEMQLKDLVLCAKGRNDIANAVKLFLEGTSARSITEIRQFWICFGCCIEGTVIPTCTILCSGIRNN